MDLLYGCRHIEEPSYVQQRYGNHPTRWVSEADWYGLGNKIRKTKQLRHSTTIALPPTGRSGLVINASPGVEPLFSFKDPDGEIREVVRQLILDNEILQQISEPGKMPASVPETTRRVLVASTDIAAIDHLKMVAALQTVVDE